MDYLRTHYLPISEHRVVCVLIPVHEPVAWPEELSASSGLVMYQCAAVTLRASYPVPYQVLCTVLVYQIQVILRRTKRVRVHVYNGLYLCNRSAKDINEVNN